MDDIFGDFFGTSPMTDSERESKIQELLGKVEVNHVIQEGKVFMDADRLVEVFTNMARMMALRAVLTRQPESLLMGQGIALISEVIGEIRSEFLKRQAETSL